MRVHAVYRSTVRENSKPRPAFYSKLLSLYSFLRAVEECEHNVELTFLNDGAIPGDRLRPMAAWGRILDVADVSPPTAGRQLRHTTSGSTGLTRSYFAALDLADREGWGQDELVYYVEDDYLHAPMALARLVEAAERIPDASYFSLYAHRGRREGTGPLDTAGGSWHLAESTTSTFAARVGALRADRWIHRLSFFAGGTADEDTCHAYQGILPFEWAGLRRDLIGRTLGCGTPAGRIKRAAAQTALNALAVQRRRKPHLLAAPFPSMAMHCEGRFPGRADRWELLADESREWARRREGAGDAIG